MRCTFEGRSAALCFEPNVSSPACSAPTPTARSTRGSATCTPRAAFASSSAAWSPGGAAPNSPPRSSAGACTTSGAKPTERFCGRRALGSGATAWALRLTRGTPTGVRVNARAPRWDARGGSCFASRARRWREGSARSSVTRRSAGGCSMPSRSSPRDGGCVRRPPRSKPGQIAPVRSRRTARR